MTQEQVYLTPAKLGPTLLQCSGQKYKYFLGKATMFQTVGLLDIAPLDYKS